MGTQSSIGFSYLPAAQQNFPEERRDNALDTGDSEPFQAFFYASAPIQQPFGGFIAIAEGNHILVRKGPRIMPDQDVIFPLKIHTMTLLKSLNCYLINNSCPLCTDGLQKVLPHIWRAGMFS